MIKNLALVTSVMLALAACVDSPDNVVEGSELRISSRGDGTVAGSAGPAWSDEELQSNAFGAVCGSQSVTSIDIDRGSDGTATFTATCG